MKAISRRLSSLLPGHKEADASEKSKATTDNTNKSPSPPQEHSLPPLLPTELPLVLPQHNYNLADQGWTTLTFPTSSQHDLQTSLSDLFQASQAFFNKPEEYKSTFLSNDGSEEGFSIIPGEKEFITLREISSTPAELQAPASRVWAAAGDVLHEMLGKIAESLDLPPDVYQRFSKPCTRLDQVRRGTMLRLFRYENTAPKTVAEPHCDLGLLSLVMGDTPGLEVWNKYQKRFVPIEQTYSPSTNKASILVGRQLQKFSNNRYTAGGHRVVAYDADTLGSFANQRMDPRYRFSIVFVLRADWNVIVDTDTMTSPITGEHTEKIKGETAGSFFKRIQKAHFNINIGMDERDKQKKEMAEKWQREQAAKQKVEEEEEVEGSEAYWAKKRTRAKMGKGELMASTIGMHYGVN